MQKLTRGPLTKDPMRRPTHPEPLSPGYTKSLWILLLAGMMMLSACGGGSSSTDSPSATLAGNWQFSLTNPDSAYNSGFQYGLQGGFLLQNNGAVTGQAVYSVAAIQSNQQWAVCNSGTATITGTISGQAINLKAVAGSQTYTLQNGTLSSDGSTISLGTFTATQGTAADGSICGIATTTPLAWSAQSVPPLTGSITGTFHSAGLTPRDQDFPVTGSLTQGENIGAGSVTVTGTLSFIDPTTLLSDYPCFPAGTVFINGEISGNTVVLQLIGNDGSSDGQIGIAASQASSQSQGPVFFDSTTNGYVLHSHGTDTNGSAAGTAYIVNTKACTGNPGDFGYICLALNSTTACQQPVTLSPALLTFPPQLLGSTNPNTQMITLTNNSGQELDNLTLAWSTTSGVTNSGDVGSTDFTGIPDFMEADNCVPGGETFTNGSATSPNFSLAAGSFCSITISFAPQESCTWLPGGGGNGTAPAQCPLTMIPLLTIQNVPSVDNDTSFAVPISGTGLSFVQPSTPELDFGAEAFGETSLPQMLSFTNYGATPVQILAPRTCMGTFNETLPLPHPLVATTPVPGLQVVTGAGQDVANSTIRYTCDFDSNTSQPNFQISADTCSGTLLAPQAACSLQITFVPQSLATYYQALDYFLELNTVQCTDPVNDPPSPSNPCELDGGRFPVELKANINSPLRMSPAAGLDFGIVPVGKSGATQTVTLLNDPNVTNAPTVTFVGKFVVSGSYAETDDCPFSLAPGASCTLTLTFKPKSVGYNSGQVAINYTPNPTNQVQTVYLHGWGH